MVERSLKTVKFNLYPAHVTFYREYAVVATRITSSAPSTTLRKALKRVGWSGVTLSYLHNLVCYKANLKLNILNVKRRE